MKSNSHRIGIRHTPRTTGVKALAGALLATLGIAAAYPAFADRDSFPAWQQKQFARQTAQPEVKMTAPRTTLAGRDASFQNWRARESASALHDVRSDVASTHQTEHNGMSGSSAQ